MNGDREPLVIYGDFNCPFSALASMRATVLERRDGVAIEWRAVEHDPTIPLHGEALTGELREELLQELTQVRGLLRDGEPDELRLPDRRPNTHRVTLAYAATDPRRRPVVRARLFEAYWKLGEDLNAPGLLDRLGARAVDEVTAARWRGEWQALPRPIVPEMVLPDGTARRGIHALDHLAELVGQPVSDAGGVSGSPRD